MAIFKQSNEIKTCLRVTEELAEILSKSKFMAEKVGDHYAVLKLPATDNNLLWWARQHKNTWHLEGQDLYVGISLTGINNKAYWLLSRGEKSHPIFGSVFCFIEDPSNSKETITTKVDGVWSSCNGKRFYTDLSATAGYTCKEVIRKLTAAIREDKIKEFEKAQTPLVQQWLKEMNKLDIFYAFSDDLSVYKSGKASVDAGIHEGVCRGITNAAEIYGKWMGLKVNG